MEVAGVNLSGKNTTAPKPCAEIVSTSTVRPSEVVPNGVKTFPSGPISLLAEATLSLEDHLMFSLSNSIDGRCESFAFVNAD